jgi:hypothetical protein
MFNEKSNIIVLYPQNFVHQILSLEDRIQTGHYDRLLVASIDLDPEHFKRDYEFGCDCWKAWENVKIRDPAI